MARSLPHQVCCLCGDLRATHADPIAGMYIATDDPMTHPDYDGTEMCDDCSDCQLGRATGRRP